MDTLSLIVYTTIILLIVGGITAVNFAARQRTAPPRKRFRGEHKRTVDQTRRGARN